VSVLSHTYAQNVESLLSRKDTLMETPPQVHLLSGTVAAMMIKWGSILILALSGSRKKRMAIIAEEAVVLYRAGFLLKVHTSVFSQNDSLPRQGTWSGTNSAGSLVELGGAGVSGGSNWSDWLVSRTDPLN
jgi:hypothetical protein